MRMDAGHSGSHRHRNQTRTLSRPMEEQPSGEPQFVVCIHNDGFEVDLTLHKIYAVLSDPVAERSGFIRIVDESGEDYLHAESYFRGIEVPRSLRDELLRAP